MTEEFSRKDALFWGQFIRAAEKMYEQGQPDPVGPVQLPGNWIRTQNITMQARVEFLHHDEFIGFTAEAPTDSKHQVIVFHGSQTLFDWIDDFEFYLEDFPYVAKSGTANVHAKTEYGFTQLYESFSFTNLKTGAIQTLAQYLQTVRNTASYTVAGHSLGGALAILHAAAAAHRGAKVTAYTFAAPMVGDQAFVQDYHSLVDKSYSIINLPDIVPHLPGQLLGYEPTPNVISINSLDVPEIKHCLRCYHHLETYLYTLGCSTCNLGSCRVE